MVFPLSTPILPFAVFFTRRQAKLSREAFLPDRSGRRQGRQAPPRPTGPALLAPRPNPTSVSRNASRPGAEFPCRLCVAAGLQPYVQWHTPCRPRPTALVLLLVKRVVSGKPADPSGPRLFLRQTVATECTPSASFRVWHAPCPCPGHRRSSRPPPPFSSPLQPFPAMPWSPAASSFCPVPNLSDTGPSVGGKALLGRAHVDPVPLKGSAREASLTPA